jgi:alkylated DNA repair dioxygenase AlkB
VDRSVIAEEAGGLCPPSVDFYHIEDFLPKPRASILLNQFGQEFDWQAQEIFLFGRKVMQPRLTCWFADTGVEYAYSGLKLTARPWHPELLKLRASLQHQTGHSFNSVLANAYRNGKDSMGWHADDEKELGPQPVIAALSLGAGRKFKMQSRDGIEKRDFQLESGSLFVMQHHCQTRYRHAVPKTAKNVGLRINLTFRLIRNLV